MGNDDQRLLCAEVAKLSPYVHAACMLTSSPSSPMLLPTRWWRSTSDEVMPDSTEWRRVSRSISAAE
ncbi:hypothetical protein [Paraburkholderia tropica]|uniref:hypothetical protein n=1 Tax=Paraburkholderia tropica TaxID=92647 RepID=UPI0015920D5A|nr:hypothetical protein [Paraburkholderia tropica]